MAIYARRTIAGWGHTAGPAYSYIVYNRFSPLVGVKDSKVKLISPCYHFLTFSSLEMEIPLNRQTLFGRAPRHEEKDTIRCLENQCGHYGFTHHKEIHFSSSNVRACRKTQSAVS